MTLGKYMYMYTVEHLMTLEAERSALLMLLNNVGIYNSKQIHQCVFVGAGFGSLYMYIYM